MKCQKRELIVYKKALAEVNMPIKECEDKIIEIIETYSQRKPFALKPR